ncbi:MAG TPA: hypothetical protein VES39_10185, partial [Rhodospirillales bacterium]|nr:hypothetical protein [Rhodospirillales bacterium]
MTALTPNAFPSLPRTAVGHRDLLVHAVVFALVRLLRQRAAERGEALDDALRALPFLADRFTEARALMPDDVSWGGGGAWWTDAVASWEAGCREPLPLLAAARELRLALAARLALVAIGLVEHDGRFGTVVATLQGPAAGRRPTVQLLGELLGDAGPAEGGSDGWSLCRPLLRAGLVEAPDQQAPRGDWALQVPAPLWDAAAAAIDAQPVAGWRLTLMGELAELDALIHPSPTLERLRALPALLAGGEVRTLVVRGDVGSDGLEVVGAVARRLRRGLLSVAAAAMGGEAGRDRLGPLCTLTGSLPVLTCDLAPGETLQLPELAGYAGPVAVLLGAEGGVGDGGRQLTLVLPMPDRELRAPLAAGARRPPCRRRHLQRALPPRRRADPPHRPDGGRRGGACRPPPRAGGGRAAGAAGGRPPAPRHPGGAAGDQRKLAAAGHRRGDAPAPIRAGAPLPPPRTAARSSR